MRTRLLDLIVCPGCGARLICTAAASDGEEVVTGRLDCEKGCSSFPVVRGIPRLQTGAVSEPQQRTADAFGWEWQQFHRLHDESRTREQFLDWIRPLEPSDFAGKVVLDAGCGMGRFAVTAAGFGARDVIAVDLSDAVEAAAENGRRHGNVHVIQADLHRLPLARRGAGAVVDLAYCIGVLHHLPDPERGFAAVAGVVKQEGALFAWVYGRENNGWLVHLVNPLRELVSSRLPRQALYVLSFLLTLALTVPLKCVYLPVGRFGWLRPAQRLLPYRPYLNWLAGFGFRHNHHVVFDHLVAPTAFYIRREEFEAWFAPAGLAVVAISARNQNSWRGLGRPLTTAAPAVATGSRN